MEPFKNKLQRINHSADIVGVIGKSHYFYPINVFDVLLANTGNRPINFQIKNLQMKSSHYLVLLLAFITLSSCAKTKVNSSDAGATDRMQREIYQIKTYTFDTDEQASMTEEYLKNAYMPALKRLNIKNIGVFKTRLTEKDTVNKLYVLLPLKSLTQIEDINASLAKDMVYKAAGSKYITTTYDMKPYRRMESTLLRAFEKMPVMKPTPLTGPRRDRIYELRSYESATEAIHENKVDMFNAGGEVDLFQKLQFNAVFYGQVISGSKMPNLMYMTTFADQASRDAHWKSFGDAPEWKTMKALPKYQNNVSHSDIMFLYPTDYSDY